MKVAIITCLTTKRDVDIDSGHKNKLILQISVFSLINQTIYESIKFFIIFSNIIFKQH